MQYQCQRPTEVSDEDQQQNLSEQVPTGFSGNAHHHLILGAFRAHMMAKWCLSLCVIMCVVDLFALPCLASWRTLYSLLGKKVW